MSWEKLHRESRVVDLHNHSVLKKFLFNRDLSGNNTKFLSKLFKRAFWPLSERSNFPLIKKGGLDVVLSTCYIPEVEWLDDQSLVKLALAASPSTRKRVFNPSYFDATVAMMDCMEKEILDYQDIESPLADNPNLIKIVTSKNDLIGCLADNDVAIIHSVEGAHSLQGSECGKREGESNPNNSVVENEILKNLEYLFDRGVAYLTLAHFYPNKVVSPVFPYPTYGINRSNWKHLLAGWDMNKGLTAIGAKVVGRMLELGMLIDVAHCTPKARSEIYEIVGSRKNCLLASHTGAFEINRDPYNLEDWELKWFADHDCVTGIIFMNYWLSPIDSPLGLKYIEQTVSHIRDVAGANVLGIGTDFDGFTDPPDEITDMSEIPRITRYLYSLKRYSDEEIEGFLGKNSIRLLMDGWGK